MVITNYLCNFPTDVFLLNTRMFFFYNWSKKFIVFNQFDSFNVWKKMLWRFPPYVGESEGKWIDFYKVCIPNIETFSLQILAWEWQVSQFQWLRPKIMY